MNKVIDFKQLGPYGSSPTQQQFNEIYSFMLNNPDPSALDDRITTIALKHITKAVCMYLQDRKGASEGVAGRIFEVAHDYCIHGANRIETGRIFLEDPTLDVPSIQKMLPHFYSHGADFAYKGWKVSREPASLESALEASEAAMRESLEDDYPGVKPLLILRSLIFRDLFNTTGDLTHLAARVDACIQLCEIGKISEVREARSFRMHAAKDSLHLAMNGFEPEKYARIAYDLAGELSEDGKGFDRMRYHALKVLEDGQDPIEDIVLKQHTHLKRYLSSLVFGNKQALRFLHDFRELTLELSQGDHMVAYESGKLLYGLADPTDTGFRDMMSFAAGLILYSLSEDDGAVERARVVIDICQQTLPQLEGRDAAFMELKQAKAYHILYGTTGKRSHRHEAIKALTRSQKGLQGEDCEGTLAYIKDRLNMLTPK